MMHTPEDRENINDKLVICYCAAWCRTCGQYQPLFQGLSEKLADWSFVWVDIEQHPDWLIDDDIEDFPTILIQDQQGIRFLGTLLPHIEHLEQLLATASDLPVSDTAKLDLSQL